MDIHHDGRYWRICFVSRIQNKWLRRLALVGSAPIMLAWNVSLWALVTAWVVIVAPFVVGAHYWPAELFRSIARRWSVPLPPLRRPADVEGERG